MVESNPSPDQCLCQGGEIFVAKEGGQSEGGRGIQVKDLNSPQSTSLIFVWLEFKLLDVHKVQLKV